MLEYKLIRSARRSIAIQVGSDGLVVRAPNGMSRAAIEAFIEKHIDWINERLEAVKRAGPRPQLTQEMEARCRKQAKTLLPGLVAKYAPLVGAYPASIKVTGAQKRFGSCTSKGNVNFAWRLMLYPLEAIEYVVVHELTHLKHMNHSSAFYAAVARVMPDYKRREALLKRPWWEQ